MFVYHCGCVWNGKSTGLGILDLFFFLSQVFGLFVFSWRIYYFKMCQFLLHNSGIICNCTYISSLLSIPSNSPIPPPTSSQSAMLSFFPWTAASPRLCVLYVVVYPCQQYSQFGPPSPYATVSINPFSTSVSLFLTGRQVHQYQMWSWIFSYLEIFFHPTLFLRSSFSSYINIRKLKSQMFKAFSTNSKRL